MFFLMNLCRMVLKSNFEMTPKSQLRARTASIVSLWNDNPKKQWLKFNDLFMESQYDFFRRSQGSNEMETCPLPEWIEKG